MIKNKHCKQWPQVTLAEKTEDMLGYEAITGFIIDVLPNTPAAPMMSARKSSSSTGPNSISSMLIVRLVVIRKQTSIAYITKLIN